MGPTRYALGRIKFIRAMNSSRILHLLFLIRNSEFSIFVLTEAKDELPVFLDILSELTTLLRIVIILNTPLLFFVDLLLFGWSLVTVIILLGSLVLELYS